MENKYANCNIHNNSNLSCTIYAFWEEGSAYKVERTCFPFWLLALNQVIDSANWINSYVLESLQD